MADPVESEPAEAGDDAWMELDEDLTEDVELLRFIIKKQRQKLSCYNCCLHEAKIGSASIQKKQTGSVPTDIYLDAKVQMMSVLRDAAAALVDQLVSINSLADLSKPIYEESLIPDPYLSTAGKQKSSNSSADVVHSASAERAPFRRDSLDPILEEECAVEETSVQSEQEEHTT